jgi:hypothetical protein
VKEGVKDGAKVWRKEGVKDGVKGGCTFNEEQLEQLGNAKSSQVKPSEGAYTQRRAARAAGQCQVKPSQAK